MLMILVVATACGEGEAEWTSDSQDIADQVAETPVAEATPEAEPSPTPAINAGADEDPRDVLVALVQDPEDPDLELIYQYLPERFKVLDFDEVWVRSVAQNLPNPGLVESREDLDVEEYEGYTLVRHRDLFPARWIFVIEDGEWRWDPGNRNLITASGRVQTGPDEGLSFGMGPGEFEMVSDSDPSPNLMPPPLNSFLYGVGAHGDVIDIVMGWEVRPTRTIGGRESVDSHLLSDAIIPLDSIVWYAGDESGEVEVRWTDAGLVDGEITLHGWPSADAAEEAAGETDQYPMMRYGLTLRLLDLPPGTDEIVLRLEDITVGPFGDDFPDLDGEVITYQYEFYFPPETTDPILAGEAPKLAERSGRDEVPQVPTEDEIPPSPPLDDVVDVVEVDYERSDERVEASLLLEFGETMLEIPGPGYVTWGDGVETEFFPQIVGGQIDVTIERDDAPPDAEITSITFEQLVRSLEIDEGATFHEDHIETRWGTFPITNIVEADDGSATIHYQPAGPRWIRLAEIEHDGRTVGIRGVSTTFDTGFQPRDPRIDADSSFVEARESFPLPAEVEVWEAAKDTTIEVRQ